MNDNVKTTTGGLQTIQQCANYFPSQQATNNIYWPVSLLICLCFWHTCQRAQHNANRAFFYSEVAIAEYKSTSSLYQEMLLPLLHLEACQEK